MDKKKILKKQGMGMSPFGKDSATDLKLLYKLAKKKLKGTTIIFRKHPIAKLEPQCKEAIGYFPSGENQILFKKDGKVISCIRGAVSFGYYECWGIEGFNTGSPERFEKPAEVIKWVKQKFA